MPGGGEGKRAGSIALTLLLLLLLLLPYPAHGQSGSPAGPIPVSRLEARREALLKRIWGGIAIVPAAEERSIEGDYPQDSDYRENNNFFYLTGLESPGAWLVLIGADSTPSRTILYLSPRDTAQERWTGPRLGPGAEATAQTGIPDTRPATQAKQEIRTLVAANPHLLLELTPKQGEDSFIRELVFGSEVRTVEDLSPHLGALRVIKDADELVRLRRAINITDEAEKVALRSTGPGSWEYEVESVVEGSFRKQGAERVGYPSIIGSGINGTTLRYDKNRRQTRAGDLVVADVGAEFGYYSADVTRTFPVSGKFTPRRRALYDLVLATQQAAIDSIRPGVTVRDLNRIARQHEEPLRRPLRRRELRPLLASRPFPLDRHGRA